MLQGAHILRENELRQGGDCLCNTPRYFVPRLLHSLKLCHTNFNLRENILGHKQRQIRAKVGNEDGGEEKASCAFPLLETSIECFFSVFLKVFFLHSNKTAELKKGEWNLLVCNERILVR